AAAALLMAELSASRSNGSEAAGYLWKAYRLFALTFGLYEDDCWSVLQVAGAATKLTAPCEKWSTIAEYFPTEDVLISQEIDALLNKGDLTGALLLTAGKTPPANTSSPTSKASEIESLNTRATINLIQGRFEDAEKKLDAAHTKSSS